MVSLGLLSTAVCLWRESRVPVECPLRIFRTVEDMPDFGLCRGLMSAGNTCASITATCLILLASLARTQHKCLSLRAEAAMAEWQPPCNIVSQQHIL